MSKALSGYLIIAAILLLTYLFDVTKFGFDKLGTVILIVFATMSIFVYMRRDATIQSILLGMFLVTVASLRTINWLGYIQIEEMESILITIVAVVGLIHCTSEAKYQADL